MATGGPAGRTKETGALPHQRREVSNCGQTLGRAELLPLRVRAPSLDPARIEQPACSACRLVSAWPPPLARLRMWPQWNARGFTLRLPFTTIQCGSS